MLLSCGCSVFFLELTFSQTVETMFLVGLTGSVGTGKSTVSQMFASLGVPVIDADQIARDAVAPNSRAWRAIRDHPSFGQRVLNADGELDREAVAAQIFNDSKSRKILEGIIHPEVRKEMIRQIIRQALRGRSWVILDVPLLFEKSPLLRFCHKIIVVRCSKEKQIERLRKRNDWSEEHMNQRIATQMPQEEKVKLADYVIDNSGSLAQTRNQILELYDNLNASKFHWIVRGVFATGVLLLSVIIVGMVAIARWLFS